MTTTDFDSWIDSNVDINDVYNFWAAYHTVSSETNYHPFEKTKKGSTIYLKKVNKDETLALVSDDARTAFSNKLEYPYASQGGIDLAKAMEDQMGKD